MTAVSILDGRYGVLADGTVIRLRPAQGATVGASVKAFLSNGYMKVCLSSDGQITNHWIHRLVAQCFIGPCPPGMNVNHIDGNKSNNSVGNLEYVTYSENHKHALRTGLRKASDSSLPGELNGSAKLTEKDVVAIRKRRAETGDTFESIGASFGISKGAAHSICVGRSWRHVK